MSDKLDMSEKLIALKRIEERDDIYILCEEAGKLVGIAPQALREQAKSDPSKLGFNVIVAGTSIRIPRLPFLQYLKGS